MIYYENRRYACRSVVASEGTDPRSNETVRESGIIDHSHPGIESRPCSILTMKVRMAGYKAGSLPAAGPDRPPRRRAVEK